MDAPAASPLQIVVVAPISEALSKAKQGDFGGAMTRLSIHPSVLPEAEFREELVALHSAMQLIFNGGAQEAAGDFRRCSALIDGIGLPEVCSYLAILRDLSFGFASLQTGDPGAAQKHFNAATSRSEKMGFVYEVSGLILEGQIGAKLASFNTAFALGQLDQAEVHAGSILRLQRDFQKRAADAGGVPPEMILTFSMTALEVATTLAEQAMNALDYDSAKRQLAAAADAAARIAENQTALSSFPHATLIQAAAALFHLMNKLVEVAASVIAKHEPVSSETLKSLDQAYDLLFEAERLAAQTGDRGALKRAMIRRMRSLTKNLTDIVRLEVGGVATRYAGPLFGASLLVLMGAEYALIRPNAAVWPVMMLGDLIAALIVAFGYGALRFRSLLGLYADVAGKAKQGAA